MNATSFIRIVSLALAETLTDRKEIIVSDMDHEANVATWLALERQACRFAGGACATMANLHTSDLEPLLNDRTRLVACTMASNALGSIVDVKEVARLAHQAGSRSVSRRRTLCSAWS